MLYVERLVSLNSHLSKFLLCVPGNLPEKYPRMIHRRHKFGKCNKSAVFTIETLPLLQMRT